jgi:zinc transporter, ZIP family
VAEAGFWGLVAASSLLIGAAIGITVKLRMRELGLLLGFGAGTLISALAFELTEEAFALGGADIVALGLGAGALTYFVGDRLIDRRGGGTRMRTDQTAAEGTGLALLLGAILDGIPECAVLGITVLEAGTVSVPLLAAVFLSNLPEAVSSAAGMRNHTRRQVLMLWAAVVLVCALAAALGYQLLDGASGDVVGFVQAFAGGAVLMTVADAMLPEAQRLGGKAVGLATVFGFALAYLLSTLD